VLAIGRLNLELDICIATVVQFCDQGLAALQLLAASINGASFLALAIARIAWHKHCGGDNGDIPSASTDRTTVRVLLTLKCWAQSSLANISCQGFKKG
jgi:hypothetical protein